MARIRFLRHVLPAVLVMWFAGLFHLAPLVRRSVEKIDASVEEACAEAGASDKDACVDALIALLVFAERAKRRSTASGSIPAMDDLNPNHAQAMPACDFFVSVTASFQVVYVFVIMEIAYGENTQPRCK